MKEIVAGGLKKLKPEHGGRFLMTQKSEVGKKKMNKKNSVAELTDKLEDLINPKLCRQYNSWENMEWFQQI